MQRTFLITLTAAFIAAAIAPQARAAGPLIPATPYASGEDLCSTVNRPTALRVTDEQGKFVSVPIDYKNPQRGNTKIYAWTYGPFDPARESVVFFAGGPGTSAHGFMRISQIAPSFNVIQFDQRGVACSHPSDPQLMNDPNYFSSEAAARDADEIRKQYGIEKWSAYGHSYGTVPATIHANLFAATTKALTLEGTIFDGLEKLWLAPHRIKILNRYFEKLPETLQNQILNENQTSPAHWFSAYAQHAMYENYPLKNLTERLQSLFFADPATRSDKINDELDTTWVTQDTQLGYAAYSFAMISCQELSGAADYSNWYAVFKDRKLVPAKIELIQGTCQQLGLTATDKTYFASRYPVKIPVTYFQGGLDGATEAPSAIYHYKKVAQGPAQLLIAPQGGHSAIQFAPRDASFLQDLIAHAIRGEKIDAVQLKASNRTDDYKIVITNKGF